MKFKITIISLFIFLLFSCAFQSVNLVHATDSTTIGTGWLTGYTYRKKHLVNFTGSNVIASYYQTEIAVAYNYATDEWRGDVVNTGGLCLTGYGDIRFTDSDGLTQLSYFAEYQDGNYRYFWVKVPKTAILEHYIYAYFGNQTTAYGITTSNGDNTFDFYDSFNVGSSVDLSKWTVINYAQTCQYGNKLHINSSGMGVTTAPTYLRAKSYFSYAHAILSAWNLGTYGAGVGFGASTESNFLIDQWVNSTGTFFKTKVTSGTTDAWLNANSGFTAEYRYVNDSFVEGAYLGSGINNWLFILTYFSIGWKVLTSYIAIPSLYPEIYCPTGSYLEVGWLAVKSISYNGIEPTQVGSGTGYTTETYSGATYFSLTFRVYLDGSFNSSIPLEIKIAYLWNTYYDNSSVLIQAGTYDISANSTIFLNWTGTVSNSYTSTSTVTVLSTSTLKLFTVTIPPSVNPNPPVNILDIPIHLATALGISILAAGLICGFILLLCIVLPVLVFTDNNLIILIFCIFGLCLGVALGWLPYVTLILIILIIALLYAGKIRDFLSGGATGEEK